MFKVGDEVIDNKECTGRVICVDFDGEGNRPIICLIRLSTGKEYIRSFDADGCYKGRDWGEYFIKHKPKTVWVNVNKTKEGMYFISAAAYKTENEARLRKCSESYVTTIELPA